MKRTLGEGKYLRLVQTERWEYVERTNVTGVVIIVPITAAGEVVFVEQFRPPLNSQCIELPAGLAGDLPEHSGEDLSVAVRRELLEETGFSARSVKLLGTNAPSGGLTSEQFSFYLATGLKRVSDGGGDGDENIIVHVIPRAKIAAWLKRQAKAGKVIATSVYAGLWFADQAKPLT